MRQHRHAARRGSQSAYQAGPGLPTATTRQQRFGRPLDEARNATLAAKRKNPGRFARGHTRTSTGNTRSRFRATAPSAFGRRLILFLVVPASALWRGCVHAATVDWTRIVRVRGRRSGQTVAIPRLPRGWFQVLPGHRPRDLPANHRTLARQLPGHSTGQTGGHPPDHRRIFGGQQTLTSVRSKASVP